MITFWFFGTTVMFCKLFEDSSFMKAMFISVNRSSWQVFQIQCPLCNLKY